MMTMAPETIVEDNKVRLTRFIKASPERVFDALTRPEDMTRWMGPEPVSCPDVKVDLREGGAYRLRMIGPDNSEYIALGEYITVDRPSKLVFTWQWQDEEWKAMEDSQVTFILRPVVGGTQLELLHERFPTPQSARNHAEGWGGSLDKLETLFA